MNQLIIGKFDFVHKRWEALYDYEGSTLLKEAMKRHLFKLKFSNAALAGSDDPMKDNNPLSYWCY
jgi:hypothetical protein